jgi:hypothetical protein
MEPPFGDLHVALKSIAMPPIRSTGTKSFQVGYQGDSW